MLDAVPRIGARVAIVRGGVGVDDRCDGAVADRVHGDLPAGTVRLHDQAVKAVLVHLEVAAIAGLTFEVIEHRRSASDE